MTKKKPTLIERRLFSGAVLLLTKGIDGENDGWSWVDTGRTARRDICQRLLGDSVIEGDDNGLFPGMGQTFRLSAPTLSKGE